jgi:hypothetical protein
LRIRKGYNGKGQRKGQRHKDKEKKRTTPSNNESVGRYQQTVKQEEFEGVKRNL